MSEAAPDKPRVLLDYLRLAVDFLEGKGVEGARLEVEVMLASVLGLTRMDLYTRFDQPVAADEVDRFRALLRRRGSREPSAYIVGSREFWSLDFQVDRRVLIPRPETEHLVEWGLDVARAKADSDGQGLRIVDVGTGSGAVAIALASELSKAEIVAVDDSAAALEVAPANAERLGCAGRIRFEKSNLLEALDGDVFFDLVVSNPPYVTADEYKGLEPELRDWEPKIALEAGADGLSVTQPLIAQAASRLVPGGWLLVEVGTQSQAVKALFEAAGFIDVAVRDDLAGLPRVVGGCRPE